MEDIQVGDPLKDLYNEFNPKLKLANSFDEFKSVMSNPNNRKDFYNEFNSQLKLANSFDEFDSVIGLKKKDIGGAISSPTASQSVSKSFISSLPEQKSIYAPSEKIVSESTTVVAPKEAKLVSEANKRGDQITKEAIENSNDLYLKMQNKFGNKVSKETPYIVQNKKELEGDLKSGALQVVKSPKTGKYVLAHNSGIFDSFSNAWDNVKAKQDDDRYVAGLNTEEKIKHYEVKDFLNQDKYLEAAPSGFAGSVGRTLGENAEPLIKLSATALAAGKAASALGASADIVSNIQKFASFLTFATDAGYSGYADNTERVYKSLREQNPNGDKVEQMNKAENAGLIGEASGIGMAAGMSGMFSNLKSAAQTINTKPFVSALETMAKHTAKEASVQGSVAALSSIASDLGAKSQGMDLSAGDIASKAFETGASTAKFVTILSTAMGTATGLLKVPGYVKSQAKKLVSEMPREEVTAIYKSAEDKGILPEGTTNKVINSLNEYDKAKEKLPEGLSDEHKGALTGIQEKIDKLEKSKEKLAPQYHARVDDTIKSLKDRAVKILDSKDPMSEEVDNILNVKGSEEIAGPPVTEADLIEQVAPKEVKVKEQVKPTEEEISVYHGGGIKDLADTEGGLFVSADKSQAESYAKGNKGKVQEFKLNKNDISNENNVREVISELGLKSKEEGWDLNDLMLHEIIDPRFETSLSEGDLNKLFKELDKRGYKAIEMLATDVSGKQRNVKDILVLNPKETLKEAKPIEEKLKKGEKYVYHHTGENISNITEGSAWFTSNKFGTPTRARGINKIVKIINPSDFNLASNKEFMSLSDMSLNEKKKVLQERGYEGVKRTVDGDSHYWIFDVSKLKDVNIAEKAKEVKPTEIVEVKSEELDKLKKILNSNDVIPATYKIINIDEKIEKNNEIIKNGNPLDVSFARSSNQTLLELKKIGKKEFQETDKPPKGYNLTKVNGKEYFTSREKYNPQEQLKPKEEKTFAQKDLDRAEAKKIHGKVSEMEPPSDAEQIALRYLAEGGKVSQDAINEVSGTTKGPSLNTGRRELKTAEVKARDYAEGNESLNDLAHRLWELNGQKISERDIKNALMSEIGSNNTRLDASKAYLERYNPEYQAEQYYNRLAEERQEEFLKEQEELERQLREPLDEQIEGEASEEHINNLIKQYEAEFERENKQLESEGEREVAKEVSGRSLREEAPKEKSVEQAYKDLTRNEKRRIINSKFEELLTNEDFYKKFKIKSKCL